MIPTLYAHSLRLFGSKNSVRLHHAYLFRTTAFIWGYCIDKNNGTRRSARRARQVFARARVSVGTRRKQQVVARNKKYLYITCVAAL